jgi:hypothetical protein
MSIGGVLARNEERRWRGTSLLAVAFFSLGALAAKVAGRLAAVAAAHRAGSSARRSRGLGAARFADDDAVWNIFQLFGCVRRAKVLDPTLARASTALSPSMQRLQ